MTPKAVGAAERLKRSGAIYSQLGARPIINAAGTPTVLGGSIMDAEVAEAMAEASRAMVSIPELNERAGEVVARHTGAEAGLVTAGAAAGMLLQAAACMAGNDPEMIRRLPDAGGMKNEIVVKRSHSSDFVRAWRQAGAKTVWAGDAEGATRGELEAAISERTTALGFIASRHHPDSFDGLDELVSVAHRNSLPAIVDAAAMLPPVHNLRRFVEHGADMVSFSGGKAIRGPQSTGILCGRKDLIEAAALNNSPNDAVGRMSKVCKEEIVGLVVALERYMARDHEADQRRWRGHCETIMDALLEVPGVEATIEEDDWYRPVPEVSILLGPGRRGPRPDQIVHELAQGDPPVIVELSEQPGEDLYANPHNLLEGEAELVAERLRAALHSASSEG